MLQNLLLDTNVFLFCELKLKIVRSFVILFLKVNKSMFIESIKDVDYKCVREANKAKS